MGAVLSSSKGKHPQSKTKTMTPRAQASTAREYPFSRRCSISGARYPRVPRKECATRLLFSNFLESPKSMILTSK